MKLPGKDTSLWLDTTPSTDYPKLKPDVSVDVAVIGGGIAGLTTAMQLKDAGKKVAVIESKRIVHGVTGYTTAKLTSLHTLIYDELINKHSKRKAQLYGEANQAAIDHIEQFTKQHRIDCDFTRTDAYTYTESAAEVAKIKAEVKAAKQLGLPAEFTTKTELPFPVKGAVKFANQAYFHPRKYLLKLAELIDGDGSYVFEDSRVTDVKEGKPCVVQTERGNLHADQVVVASHFPILDRAGFFARMLPKKSYVLAVKIRGDVPRGMYINTASSPESFRSHPYSGGTLLMVGGQSHKVGHHGDSIERFKKLERLARKKFDVESIEYRWSTQDNMTFDKIPYIGRLHPAAKRTWVATGFKGWGMTTGTVAGILLSDLIQGKENPWHEVYNPNRAKSLFSAKSIKENTGNGLQLMKDRLMKGQGVDPEEIKKGDGKVIKHAGEKLAVYRDENGQLQVRSAVCTHMGCIVDWNQAEQTWDCPCHGSRYDKSGKVIQGPAVKDLEKKKL